MLRSLDTFAGQYLILVPGLLSVIWWVRARGPERRTYLALLLVGGVLAFLLAKTGSALISDPRPFRSDGVTAWFPAATDNGFPSDHTLLATVFAAAMWPFQRTLSGILYALAVIIGGARVIAGVHHGLDIAGGLVIGTLGVALAWQLIRLVVARRGTHPLATETETRD